MTRELFTKIYTRINWRNRSESMTTALGATLLNRMDYTLDETDSRIAALDILKAEESEVLQMVKEWAIDEETGIITVTKKNGEKIMFDLNIEKIPVNFTLSSAGILTMTTDDGTKFTADIGSMIPVLTFKASDTINVTVEGAGINKTYSFFVKEGSIKDKHLQPSYLADIKVQAQAADRSAGAAQTEADRAKTEADRAKAEADKAKQAAESAGALGDVTGVKGAAETQYRSGLVNITAANVGALPDDTVPVSKGGTGKTTAFNAINFLINNLTIGTATPADADYFISQYVNGGTTTTTYHRRPLSSLWAYIKGKINAATDIKATKDGQGNVIADTYDRNGIKIISEGVTNGYSKVVLIPKTGTSYKGIYLIYIVDYETGSNAEENSSNACFYLGYVLNSTTINITSNFSGKVLIGSYNEYGIKELHFIVGSNHTATHKMYEICSFKYTN